MTGNFLTEIGAALSSFYASNSGFFLGIGLTWTTSIVIIRIALMGLKAWTGALDGWGFVKEIGMILLVVAIMNWYGSPMPWAAVTFPHLIIDEAKDLSDKLEGAAGEAGDAKLNNAVAQVQMPSSAGWVPTIEEIIQAFYYLLVIIMIGVERVLMSLSLGVSYLLIGVVSIMGPLFIPWLLFPGLDYIAWAWFNSMLKVCFVQVIAGAVVFLNSTVLLGFFSFHPLPWKVETLATNSIQFMLVVVSSVVVTGLIPFIANSIMSGYGGGGSEGLIRGRSI